jgi:nitrate reductase NapE component
MQKLKKYQKQIFTFITILLLLQFGIFPCLTMANTFANIVGGIGLLVLILWLGIELYELVKEPSKIEEAVIEDLKTKKKSNPKQFDGVESDKPFVKTRKKSKVTIDFTDAKGMNEIDGVIKPIAEGRVKISVEEPKAQPKKEKVMGEYQLNNKEKVRKSLYKPKTK